MDLNRRKLIQTLAVGSAAFVVNACTKKSDKAPEVSGELGADDKSKPLSHVSSEDPTAKTLGYNPNAASVNPNDRTEKMGTPGKEQTCLNCTFYTPLDNVEAGGKCQLITSGFVMAEGWCKSWSLKQA